MKISSSNPEIEKTLLVGLILNPTQIGILPIKPDYFYNPNNKLAYETLLELKGNEVNLLIFEEFFTQKGGKISDILSEIDDRWISEHWLIDYVKILIDKYAERKIAQEYGETENAKELIENLKKIELEFFVETVETFDKSFENYLIEYHERAKKRKDTGTVSLVTGFDAFDKAVGMEDSNFVVLAARPGIGKSSLAMNMAVNAAMYGQNVLFFTIEMSKNRLIDRICSQLSGIENTRFKYANADNSLDGIKKDFEKIKNLFKIIHLPSGTSTDICRIVRQESLKKKVDLVVVDYIQLLSDEKGRYDNDNVRVSKISKNLKSLAGECSCAVLGLSQLSRESLKSEEPQLHHLKESGSLEQDADIVLFITREDVTDTASLKAAKVREGQAGLSFLLNFKKQTTTFTEAHNPKTHGRRTETVNQITF